MIDFGGVWAASVTPLTDDLAVDIDRFVAHVGHLLSDGCDGVVVFGTTGEAPSFTLGERMLTLEALVDGGIAADRLVVGTGCPALADTVTLSAHARRLGARGVLVMPPYLFKQPPDAGVVDWFRRLASAVPEMPILLYHFPRLSGVPITDAVVTGLLDVPNVVGVKDSSGDEATLQGFLTHRSRLAVLAGTEARLADVRTGGGAGVITAGANVNAAGIAAAWAGGETSEMLKARAEMDRLGGIVALKAALAADNHDSMRLVRPPLVPLDADAADAARKALRAAVAHDR